MSKRSATIVRTGQRIEQCAARLAELYRVAREICADGFPAEETRELTPLRDHVSLAYVDALRAEIAAKLTLDPRLLSRDLFSIHGCGPVSLHDDKFRYPGVYFVIVVAHSGRLGIVDSSGRAVRHEPGELLLLDPHKKHALVPEGLRARDHAYERAHSPVHRPEDQFLFLDFDVPRPQLRGRFRRE